MKRHHDHGTSYKENIQLGWLAYNSRGSVHYYDGEHGGMQADVVLELRLVHLGQKAGGSQLTVTLREA